MAILAVVVVFMIDLAVLYLAFVESPGGETGSGTRISAIKDRASAAQSLVTIVAIVFGGVIAAIRLQAFRDFEPHVNVQHDIRYREVINAYIHFDVKATLYNSSKVKIEIRRALFSIQQVLPVSIDDLVERHGEVFVNRTREEMQWPVLDAIEREWETGKLVVEPEERHSEV